MRMSPKLTLTVLPLKPTGSSHHADMLQVRVKPGHMTPKKKKTCNCHAQTHVLR